MRVRLLGTLMICSFAAAYGCGGSESPPPAPRDDASSDGKDAAAPADLAPDLGSDRGGTVDGPADRAPDSGNDLVADVVGSDAPRDTASDVRDAGSGDAGPDVAAPTCSDRLKNSDETDIDCGGHCGKCGPSKACLIGADCTFGICRSDHTCGECNLAPDCPGAESECQHRSCVGGVCGIARDPLGTVVALQTAGDCKSRQCAGDGTVETVNDNSDLPDDRNSCTNDFCMIGAPSHMMLPLNSPCGGLNRCNATGQCVGCVAATDCPGTDTACQTRVCGAQGVCGFSFKQAGTVVTDPAAGDCKGLQCDGAGNAQPVNSATDLPVDGNPCTTDECTDGTPSHRPIASGTTCGTDLVCDGANHCVACLSASTCPGTDTECHTRTCLSGACGISNTTGGKSTAAQVTGDCKTSQCNGAGATFTVPDVTDLPVDNNPCTADLCNGATPSNPSLTAGTSCGGGTSVCDGAGVCVGCLIATTCPGSDTECHTRTCSAGHLCGLSNALAGKLLPLQKTGDCKRSQCNGNGDPQTISDDADLPIDGTVCTGDICTDGVPSNPALASGTACGTGLICNGSGSCVGCVTVADCPGVDTACQQRSCSASGECIVTNAAAGAVVPTQTGGDCKRNQCDAAGNIVAVADDSDVPVDGNQCTQDLCMNGVPVNPPEPQDTACSQGMGTRCNGIAGAEACVQCNSAAQCPGGADTECRSRTCSAAGLCGLSLAANGAVVSTQTAGDCQRNQCDATGNIVTVTDPTDPRIDGNGCTQDLCMGNEARNPPAIQGTPCSDNGGAFCNGAGACVGCNSASDCPGGPDTECHTRACSALGICSVVPTLAGTAVAAQTAGDCRQNVCDGNGGITPVGDDTDVFIDGNQCTQDLCALGSASNPPATSGTSCNQGGLFCNGAGTCVQCLSDANCDSSHDTACNKIHCVAGACTFVPENANTPVADTRTGDCQKNVCDGTGGVSPIVDDTDVPVDGNTCTHDVCTQGVATNPAVDVGTSCSQNNGTRCDAAGACVPSFMVARIGDGTATLLTSAATPLFVEERLASDGALVRTINVPSAASTSPKPLTVSGTADSEGALALSGDRHSVSIAGYSAAAGTTGVASTASTATQRGAALIFASGAVDTSTTYGTTAFGGNNVRGSVSNNGSQIWATGNGSGATRGVFIATTGATTSTLIESTTNSGRACEIVAGQLYCDAANGALGIFAVGTGLPTGTATATSLPGTIADGAGSYYAFVLLDMVGSDGVLDTLYIADDRATAPGGIEKWTLTAGTWSLVWNTNAAAGTTGVRGLTGYAAGSSVVLLATTASASPVPNAIIRLIDTGATPTAAGVTTLVPAVPGAVTVYRGIALAPQ
jgi:hypothetical protein